MADVFISYSHEDRAVVRELAGVLTARGFSCWWDREIEVGADLRETIDRELLAAAAVVVVWSGSSATSHWVHSEAGDALERGNLVPLAIVDVKLPLPFRGLETAKLYDWPQREDNLQLQKIIGAIEALVHGETGSAVDPARMDTLDPSLSVRIANRVSRALISASNTEDVNQLKRLLDLETALSDAAIALLDGASTEVISSHLVDTVEKCLGASQIAVWHGQELAAGSGSLGLSLAQASIEDYDQILTRESENEEHLYLLRAYGVDWLYLCKRAPLTLCLGASGNEVADTLKKVPVIADLFRRTLNPDRHTLGN
jgi:hypothetical protein